MTPLRILVDLSGQFLTDVTVPKSIERVEREIAKRLLADGTLTTLPIVFEAGLMYVIDQQDALDALNGGVRRQAGAMMSEQPARSDDTSLTEYSTSRVTEAPSAPRSGLWRRVQRAGLDVATLAGRGVIGCTPLRARPDVRRSLAHARNAVVAIAGPTREQQRQPIDSYHGPAELPPVTLSPVPLDSAAACLPAGTSTSRLPRLSTVVHPATTDVVWTCGPAVDRVPLRQLAEAKLKDGFFLASLCYDLNAVLQVAWSPPGLSGALAPRTIDQLDASDLIFCISGVVQQDLCRFAADSGRPTPNTRVLLLGADLSPIAYQMEAPIDGQSAPITRRFALAVGTLDASNNYGLLLRVWQQLALEPQFDLDLVIVGRGGDATTELITKIQESPTLGRRIRWIGELADNDLAELYSSCHVFLCPRLDNAWPLPIPEALGQGRQVICSDREAYREASCGRATYLDPLDQRAWTAAIRVAASGPRAETLDVTTPTWDTCALDVRSGILSLMQDGPRSLT